LGAASFRKMSSSSLVPRKRGKLAAMRGESLQEGGKLGNTAPGRYVTGRSNRGALPLGGSGQQPGVSEHIGKRT